MNHDDERGGLPSASGVPRIKLCAGSWELERHLPNTPSPEGDEGTLLHDVTLGFKTDESLSNEQLSAVERAQAMIEESVLEWADGEEYETDQEKRYWINDPVSMQPICSGRFDRLDTIKNRDAHLKDLKFGRILVDHASINLQLRTLAVCLAQQSDFDSITVEIIQPRAPKDVQRTTACYERRHIERATKEVIQLIRNSQKPNQPRVPSLSACRWCKAKALCPEALSVVHLTTDISVQDTMAWNKLLGLYQKRWKLAVMIHDAIEQHIKQLLKDDPSLSTEIGWELAKPRVTRKIVDTAYAARELLDLTNPVTKEKLISSKELLDIATFSITKVEKLFRTKTGTKVKDTRKSVETLLGDAIEFKENQPALKEL